MATTLSDIPAVSNNLKLANVKVIKALHRLIFGTDGDRNNRKRLREFSGFGFQEGSEEYNDKLNYVVNSFSVNDLTAIANILTLEYDQSKTQLVSSICACLSDLQLIQGVNDNEDDPDDDSDEDIAAGVEQLSIRNGNCDDNARRDPSSANELLVPNSLKRKLLIKKGYDEEKINWLTIREIQILKEKPYSIFIKTTHEDTDDYKEINIKEGQGKPQKTPFSHHLEPLWPNGKPVAEAILNEI
nr:unnamed protein product [Callosobruchus analis]